MTKQVERIGIVGGGLIGMMTAYYLAKSGFEVSIFDKSGLATESTWAGGGILTPLYPWKYAKEINYLAAYSQKIYPGLVEEIQKLSGINSQYTRSGLVIDRSELNQAAIDWCKEFHSTFEMLPLAQYQNLNSDEEYVLFPDISQVRNPCLAGSLARALEKLGVNIHSNTSVSNIVQDRTGKVKLITNQGEHTFHKLVIAAGAWSANLLTSTGLDLGVNPVRGQMLLFKSVPGFLKPILLARGHYIIPRQDGRTLVGSTMENVGFDKSVTKVAEENLKSFVSEYLPGLLNYPIEKHWAGLRPGSPEGIPIIGEHPEMENVYINTGHFRNGVVLAPASAKLLHDIILGKSSFISPEKYSVNSSLDRVTMPV